MLFRSEKMPDFVENVGCCKRKCMIFGLNGGFSMRNCVFFWLNGGFLEKKMHDLRLHVR